MKVNYIFRVANKDFLSFMHMDFSSCEWGKGLMGLATLNPVENYLYTSHYPLQVSEIFFKFKEEIVQGHKIANKIANNRANINAHNMRASRSIGPAQRWPVPKLLLGPNNSMSGP